MITITLANNKVVVIGKALGHFLNNKVGNLQLPIDQLKMPTLLKCNLSCSMEFWDRTSHWLLLKNQ